MQNVLVDHLGASRLRLIFRDNEMSFLLAANATLGEVAQTLDDISKRRIGHPVAIFVTLGRQYDDA